MPNKRKAQPHNKKTGIENIKDNIKITEAKTSIMLNISPVKTNIPFKSKSPAQNKINCTKTPAPKASMRNAIPEIKSIAPKIFTKTILKLFHNIRNEFL